MKRSSTNDGNHEFSLSIERAQSRTDSFLGEYGSLAADKPKGTSRFGAIFILMNATLGAAVLNLPYAADQCGGLAVTIILQYALAIVAAFGLIMLGKCADVGNDSVYQEVVGTMTQSDLWVNFTRIGIAAYAFISCIAYLVLIGDQGQEVFHCMIGDSYDEHKELYRKLVIIVLSVVVVLPLMMPRTVSFLQIPGFVAFFSVAYVILAVAVLYGKEKSPDVNIKTSPKSSVEVFNAIPTIAFAYQCHVSGVPVYCSLKQRTIKNWIFIVCSGFTASSLSYTIVTVFGYLTFGDQIEDDILENYKYDNVPALIARFGIMVSVMMSYPVIHYCGRICLEDVYRQLRHMTNEEGNNTWTVRYYIQTCSWFTLSVIGAVFIPGISKVVALIGALASFFILGFPGICIFKYGLLVLRYSGGDREFNCEQQSNSNERKSTVAYDSVTPSDSSLTQSSVKEAQGSNRIKGNFYIGIGCVYMVCCAFIFGQSFTQGLLNLF